MSYVISKDKCIACGLCEAECPFHAIIAGDKAFKINEQVCHGCGDCADQCPEEAIYQI
jgi:MinD superfamily P-loop ATPase